LVDYLVPASRLANTAKNKKTQTQQCQRDRPHLGKSKLCVIGISALVKTAPMAQP